jgi:peptide/nickel transport system permease protein
LNNIGRFLSRWQNVVGLGIVLAFCSIALAAPTLAPRSPELRTSTLFLVPDLKAGLPVPPGEIARLGTVPLGIQRKQIDVYQTLIWGIRSALKFGVITAFLSTLIGVLIGATSAFLGGWIGAIILRITDAFLAFPMIAAVILFVQTLNLLWELSLTSNAGNPSASISLVSLFEFIDPVLLAMILFSWMPVARMTNGMVLMNKNQEFVYAAKAMGARTGRVIFRHLLPNSITPAIVLATNQVGGMVLLQAALNFIGIDAGSEWGAVLAIGRRWILGSQGNPLIYWWVFLPITTALILFGIGWSLMGDGLNEWLNPRIKRTY